MLHPLQVHMRPVMAMVCLFFSSIRQDGLKAAEFREPVHPRRNVETFAAVEAKFLRFTVASTNRGEPCLDELEIYGVSDPAQNLALADAGTLARASGTLADYRIHALRNINDGRHGNGHSWICNTIEGWVELELPQPALINRIIWSRDRLGKFSDRLPLQYRIEAAGEDRKWKLVASSNDRTPLDASIISPANYRTGDEGFSPGSGESPGPAGPASKEYILSTWRNEQGLPSNSVTAILQDEAQWLWIGTASGLVKFDGIKFDDTATTALKGLRITCLCLHPDGTVWAGTEGGGLFQETPHGFVPVAEGNELPAGTIVSLASDAGGTLWVGATTGLYEQSGEAFVRRLNGAITRLVADPCGEGMWMIFNGVLARWNGALVPLPKPASEPSRFSSLVALASEARGAGALWFGGANEYVARMAENQVTTFAEGHALLTTALQEILPASNGDIWLGTSGSGLARLRGKTMLSFGPDDALPSNSISSICEDSAGSIWVGGGDGLTRISTRRCEAVTLNDGLSHGVVMGLAESPEGKIWIGTNGGGLNQWQNLKAVPFSPSYVLDNAVVTAVLAASDGVVWAGTLRNGLARIEKEATVVLNMAHGLPENSITALCEDSNGILWIGSPAGGVSCILDDSIVQPASAESLKGTRITAIAHDEDHRLWFGTAGQGVAMLERNVLTRWTPAQGLAGSSVRSMLVDSNQYLWVGTSAGLSRWKDGRFESFTTRHGLPDDMISQIVEDRQGNLWLGTNRGIVRISPASLNEVSLGIASRLTVLQLDKTDGLPALECTGGYHPSALLMSDGRLCFGTVAGMAIIDPTRFHTPPKAPPVFIEKTSREPGNNKGMSFQFTALAYAAPQRLRFRYRLEGLENEWTEAGMQRNASYEFLPPGAFQFHVEASIDGSPWGSAQMSLLVPTPWWRSPWTVGLGTFGGILATSFVVRFLSRRRLKQRLREVEHKLALERERSRIARDIHDQLGANLTHIALLSAGEHESLPISARERFQAIAASSNELVQDVDAIVWAVNPRHGTLESLARYLSRFAEEFLTAAAMRLRLSVPVDLPNSELSPEMRHSIFLAAREVLNNCVKHSGADMVTLEMDTAGNSLTITISDNGRGFEIVISPDGDGLGNLNQRLIECGGRCEIKASPGHGTTVTFTIPIAVHP